MVMPPSQPASMPAFGEADLSNCEREQIHLAGSIQPHGALLVVSEPDLTIRQASGNAAAMLGRAKSVLGLTLGRLSAQLEEHVRLHQGSRLDRLPVAFRCQIGAQPCPFDGLLHRPPAGGLIIELEPAGDTLPLTGSIDQSLKQLLATASLKSLCDETARVFKRLAGYDRTMVYRFDQDGHGQVFAEAREPHLEAFLDNRYPASDIPQIARRLYERNRVRLLVDVDYEPVPLEPRLSPLTGAELDMSLCTLRSMSPIHIQYLKNMGVGATLVLSLQVGDRLWGLIACHHYSPRFVSYQTRALCELLAEAVATRIAALESFAQTQAELSVRRLEQRMIEAISRDGDWKAALFDAPQSLLAPVQAGGAALLLDGEVMTVGEVPGTSELRALGDWLDRQPREPVIACASLPAADPRFAAIRTVASGLLAAPLSRQGGEYLLWLRPEQVRTITWGGNPFKPVEIGDDPSQLSPRRSFSKWHQLVEGTAAPWTEADRTTARLIGSSVADVVQQFRAVRLLIAQSQLDRISAQVAQCGQPTLIADVDGSILMANGALFELLPDSAVEPDHLDALADLLAPGSELGLRLRDLLVEQRPWRGEVRKPPGDDGPGATLLVRADPVFSAPGRVLGYVLMVTDAGERASADAARLRFQAGALVPHRSMAASLRSGEDLLYRNLFNSVSGNAQLAAMEITEGVDLARIPALLDSVEASVSRSAELLEHLIWYERADE
jgi:light-regulated signal transduction histidine kinase (bacteriophytochrome)